MDRETLLVALVSKSNDKAAILCTLKYHYANGTMIEKHFHKIYMKIQIFTFSADIIKANYSHM